MTGDDIVAILDGFPEPVLLIDFRRHITAANRAAQTVFQTDLLDTRLLSVVRWPEILSAVNTALDTGEPAEATVRSPDKLQVTWHIVAKPLTMAGEGMPSIMLSLRDISHIEEAERMRSDFVANVSHELRSPLTALTGFIETLKGSAAEDPGAHARFLDIMDREAARMDRLIDDLLSLSRIEVNRHIRPTEQVDLADVATEAIDALSLHAREMNVALNLTLLNDTAYVMGDRDQLFQVLRNLIENAIKYGGEHKSVDITLSLPESAVGITGKTAQVDIADYGAGIPPQHIPRLTERFYRVDDARSRARGGTGLGLAIVKHIVNRHRGRLSIESELETGSTFSVLLPAV